MSHQRRRPFLVVSTNTRWQRVSAHCRTRASSFVTSASAADSTMGIMSPANASPVGTKARRYSPSRGRSMRRVPALRPSTRLISVTASSQTRGEPNPRSASTRSAARTRRASTRVAAAAAGCSTARRRMPEARSSSTAPNCVKHVSRVSKSRNKSPRVACAAASVFTNSSQRRDRAGGGDGGRSCVSARRAIVEETGISAADVTWIRGCEQDCGVD